MCCTRLTPRKQETGGFPNDHFPWTHKSRTRRRTQKPASSRAGTSHGTAGRHRGQDRPFTAADTHGPRTPRRLSRPAPFGRGPTPPCTRPALGPDAPVICRLLPAEDSNPYLPSTISPPAQNKAFSVAFRTFATHRANDSESCPRYRHVGIRRFVAIVPSTTHDARSFSGSRSDKMSVSHDQNGAVPAHPSRLYRGAEEQGDSPGTSWPARSRTDISRSSWFANLVSSAKGPELTDIFLTLRLHSQNIAKYNSISNLRLSHAGSRCERQTLSLPTRWRRVYFEYIRAASPPGLGRQTSRDPRLSPSSGPIGHEHVHGSFAKMRARDLIWAKLSRRRESKPKNVKSLSTCGRTRKLRWLPTAAGRSTITSFRGTCLTKPCGGQPAARRKALHHQ